MFITETHIRVRYAETDQMNVVYYGNYAQYFEVARAESIRNLGFTYKEMEAAGVMMPVVEMQTKFLRPAHYDDLLTIKTIMRELPVDHRILFEHEVFNQEKKLLTLGKVTLYFVKIGSFERTVMPETMRIPAYAIFSRNKLKAEQKHFFRVISYMTNISIITIGDELLIGQVIDTNSAWMAQELNKAGFWVNRRVAIGDGRDDILKALEEESADAELF